MASRYAVATGNWNSTGTWAATDGGAPGASFPVDGDAVFLTATSGAITVTVNVSSAATSIDATGYTGTFTGSGALQLKGNLTAVVGMVYSYTGTLTEALTAGTATLTSAGHTLCGALTMNGAGGTLTFADAFITTGTCTLTAGTWADGDQNLTMAAFSAAGTATRAITYGTTNTWYVTGSGTVFALGGSGLTTFNQDTTHPGCVINFSYTGSDARVATKAVNVYWPNVRISSGDGSFSWQDNAGVGPQLTGLDCTGYAGAMDFTGSIYAMILQGNLHLSTGMSLSASAAGVFLLIGKPVALATSVSITTTGKHIPGNVVLAYADVARCLVSLGDALTCTGPISITPVVGAASFGFDANGYDVTCATFASSSTNTRTITMGSGTWTLTSTAAATVWNMATTTGLTLNAGTATIALTGVTASTRTISANSVQLPSIAVNAGSGAVTFTNVNCDSLTFGNSYSGTIANQTITIRGGVQLSNHASFALTAGANAWTLAATTTGKTFTSQGKTVDFPLTFNGVGGGWTFADAVTHGITRTMTLTNGSLSFGTGLTHTMGFLASSNANTRTIDSGTSTLQFPATGVLVDTSTSTNLTWTGTGTLKLTNASATARSITAGTKRLPSVWVSAGTSTTTLTNVTGCIDLNMTGMGAGTIAAGSAAFAIGGSVTFVAAGTWSYTGALTFDATASKTITSAGKALTSSTVAFNGSGGTWALQDNAPATGAWTVTAGTIDVGNYTAATPSLVFSGSSTRGLSFGSGTLTLSGTGTVYDGTGSNQTVTPGTGTIRLTDASASARTVDGGTTTVTLPTLWVSAGSGSMTTANCNVGAWNCTGFTGSWENNAITSRGDITMPAGMTASAAVTAATRITAAGTGAIAIGITFDRSIYVGTSAWTLGAALVLGSSRALYVDSVTGGSFDDAGYTITAGGAGAFGAGAASWTQRANYTMQTTGTCWSMPSTMTHTWVAGRIDYTSSSVTGKTFAGGGKTYGELRFAPGSGTGSLTLTGDNTFATLSDTGTAAHAWKFTAGTTTHVGTWSIQGTAGNLITITSATAATHTLYADGGLNQADYLDISYSTAQPASLWQAMSNCVDSGNNQGWFGGASQQAMWATVRTIRNRQTARDEANGGATRARVRVRGGR